MPDLFPRENKHGHVCPHQSTFASWKGQGIFIPFLFRVMGSPAGAVTGFTKKEAKFWQVLGRPSNKTHFSHPLSHPFEMQVVSKQHEIPGNFLCPFNKSALWRKMTQSPLPPKARANSGYQQSSLHNRTYYPRSPPPPHPDSNQSPCCFKWHQWGHVYSNYYCSSGNTFLMACMCKCTHVQMDTSTYQIEEANANEGTLLSLHWVNFFCKGGRSALANYELVLLTLSNLNVFNLNWELLAFCGSVERIYKWNIYFK